MLDDAQLRTLEERLRYLRELEERRAAILESVRSQGKLDDALEAQILRRRLQGAAGGHLPALQAQAPHQGADRPRGRPRTAGRRAARPTRPWTRTAAAAALRRRGQGRRGRRGRAGGRAGRSSTERFAEDADLVGELRERMWSARPAGAAKVREGKEEAGAKFADYFDFAEPFTEAALAPDARDVPRREGGGPRPRPWTRRSPPRSRPDLVRAAHRRAASASPTAGRPGRQVAAPTPCAGPGAPGSWSHLGIDLRVRLRHGRRGRGRRRLRRQPARPAARRPGRHPRHDGARPRLPYRA